MEKIPTIKEIAKRLKISASTVSRALHGHPSIGLVTTMRVKKVAAELNYEPNQTAIFFKRRKTLTIGVIVPDLAEVFFSSALSGIEDYASKKNYNVFIGQSLENADREKRILETMKNHRVDGIIISISKNTSDYEVFNQLKRYNIPVVFFDRIPDMEDIHYTACNIQLGMLQAIDYLTERGHRNIGLINGPSQLVTSKDRLEAYTRGLNKHQITVNNDLVLSSDLSSAQNIYAMQKLLSLADKPTAVITFNDYVARDAIKLMSNYNLVANRDISFVSFANSPIWSFMDSAPLASIEQFPQKQGVKASEILFNLLDDVNQGVPAGPVFHQVVFDSNMVAHAVKVHV